MFVPATEKTPFIKFNEKESTLEVIGRSIPEDAYVFYGPLFTKLSSLSVSVPKSMKLIMQLEYFNTHSSRLILEILKKVQTLREQGTMVKVFWVCDEHDEEMIEYGEDLRGLVDLPIEITELTEDKYDQLLRQAWFESHPLI